MDVTKLSAYAVLEERKLEDLKSEGVYLIHKKSGARILLISNTDNNKVFNIAFHTPVKNSTGVPHILEHTVFCGSEKFPVKDPFIELAKGSLNTFLNAMTYPDKTVFPVASCNERDFQNLMDVYMDAVLHPNIYKYREIFRQEGWSYQLEDPEGEITYNGVVYNEMKGAFSSPDDMISRKIRASLFPDTTYAYESGGDPDQIPNLTYEEYLDFHRTYYHPSNSYIYLYGDMDMAEKLDWLDREYLSFYEAREIHSEIELQKPFEKMRDCTMTYAIAANEEKEDNTYLSYNKVIGTNLDKELTQAFLVLDYVLLSAPGAPLTSALLENGIGKDIDGSFDTSFYQPVFSIVAKNANESQKDKFIEIVEGVLRNIVQNGIDKKALEAGINYEEFRFREADYGGYPKGLIYGLDVLESWIYDEKQPFLYTEESDTFEFLKSRIDTGYFENLIRKYLLDNPHGSFVTLVPEPGKTARADEKLREKLQKYKDSLTQEEIKQMVEDTINLEVYQEEPSEEEELKKIPMLTRADISTDIAPLYNEEMDFEGIPVVFHEIETNGIGYLSFLFEITDIPEDLLPYVGVLEEALGVIDTENYNYGEFCNEVNRRTGGVDTSLELYPDVEKVKEKAFRATFEVRTRALYEQLPFAIAMMQEMIVNPRLDDAERLKEIIAMTASQMQMEFLEEGNFVALLRAFSYQSPLAKFRDIITGISYYEKINHLDLRFEEEKADLIDKLQKLQKYIFRKGNLRVSYTASREGLASLEAEISKFGQSLFPKREALRMKPLVCTKMNEGFMSSSQVQFVAQAGNFVDADEEYNGAFQVLKTILNYDYLWLNVRMKGGAYGCSANFNRLGEGCFVSYRDPNLEKTLEVYKGIPEYIRNFTVSERDMTKYIIGTFSEIDRPMTPAAKGDRSMNLYMNHVTAKMLQKERREILETTQEDIRACAGAAKAVLAADQICVIGNEEVVKDAKEAFGEVKGLV